jgi:hypothetical protein
MRLNETQKNELKKLLQEIDARSKPECVEDQIHAARIIANRIGAIMQLGDRNEERQ